MASALLAVQPGRVEPGRVEASISALDWSPPLSYAFWEELIVASRSPVDFIPEAA